MSVPHGYLTTVRMNTYPNRAIYPFPVSIRSDGPNIQIYTKLTYTHHEKTHLHSTTVTNFFFNGLTYI